jgi:serine/threonine-protein kinase
LDAPIPVEQVPEVVRGLVARGLAKNPAERPTHAGEFVRELEAVAGTAYGPDWEERGRRELAALAALLLSGRTSPASTTDFAQTMLPEPSTGGRLRPWLPGRVGLLLTAALVLLGALLAYGVQPAPAASPGGPARALATTRVGPETGDGNANGTTGDGNANGTTGDGNANGTTGDGNANGTTGDGNANGTTGDGNANGTTGDGNANGTTGDGNANGTTGDGNGTETPPTVNDIGVTEFRQTGWSTGTVKLTITTDGTGPLSLTVRWFSGTVRSEPGPPDGAPQSYGLRGKTTYEVTIDHGFQTTGSACGIWFWTVQAKTDPASADGGASQEISVDKGPCVR